MLAWLVEEVESPYGTVATLHWAVPDKADSDDEVSTTNNLNSNPGDLNTTELQVELESAEDQLGAVLWNSNPAALNYLHTHVFCLPPVGKEGTSTSAIPTAESPPLTGKRVVELGAGVGCLGIALAMAGAHVAVTDMKELLPLMAHNVKLNARRVQQRSDGRGICAALQWKWGPTVTTSVHKQLQKELKGQLKAAAASNNGTQHQNGLAEDASLRAGVERVLASMVDSLMKPSDSLVECSQALSAAAATAVSGASNSKTFKSVPAVPYHYVIMCDALYGNPKDWPALLYTLSELLSTNPEGCEVVNFCEQRVNDVEGAFLKMLNEENARLYVPAAQRTAHGGGGGGGGSGDPLWTAAVDCAVKCCALTSAEAGKKKGGSAAPSSGATSSTPAAVEMHKAREEAASALLNYVLVQQRGSHRWSYTTEVVAEAQSELNMTIRATRIRWTRAGENSTGAAESRRRPREAEKDSAESKKTKKQ